MEQVALVDSTEDLPRLLMEQMEFVIIAAPQAASAVTGTYALDTSGRSGYHVYTFTGNGSITF